MEEMASAKRATDRLLPPEQRFARFILARQQSHRTPTIVRLEENYGRDGIAFGAAAIFVGLLAAVVGLAGIVLLLISGGHGQLIGGGYILIYLGIALGLSATLRAGQGIHEGRRFRGGRPFSRS